MTNSTVSGNNSGRWGGGVYNIFADADVFNSTITNNQPDIDLNGTGTGGGVFNDGSSTFTFQNTILAGNRESGIPGECAGTIMSNGNNLMAVSNCTVGGTAPILGNPSLGPLQ